MVITKGEKTVEDYILEGVRGHYFSYGWERETGPSIYRVEQVGVTPGRGTESTLDVVIIDDEEKEGERKQFNLAIFKDSVEVFLGE